MKDKVLVKRSILVIYFLLMAALVYVICDGPFTDDVMAEPLYGYSVLLFTFCIILVLLIIRKSQTFPPSLVLWLEFLAAPIIGPIGYQIFVKIYGSFHGTQLSFEYPTFVWAVGTTALLVGIASAHYVIRIPDQYVVLWNLRRASFLVWATLFVAMFFSLYALLKIGYLPILSPNISESRTSYEAIVGDYPLKFSRLWLVAAAIASMLAFMTKPGKRYFLTVLLSSAAAIIYGQRIYPFMIAVSFVLIYCKFRRPKLRYVGAFAAVLMVAFIFYAEYRSGRSTKELSVPELVTLQLFGEWREYSLVVNELRESRDFYREEIFLGALAPLFPKQIWAAFGIDKNRLVQENTAIYVFGRQFNNPLLGIRLGTIGEAYAGYGLVYGVCLQLFLFGFLFGILEKMYVNLKKEDARLCLISFLISVLIYLPISTLYVTLAHAVFFGFFLVVYQLIATYRVANNNVAQNLKFANETLAKT